MRLLGPSWLYPSFAGACWDGVQRGCIVRKVESARNAGQSVECTPVQNHHRYPGHWCQHWSGWSCRGRQYPICWWLNPDDATRLFFNTEEENLPYRKGCPLVQTDDGVGDQVLTVVTFPSVNTLNVPSLVLSIGVTVSSFTGEQQYGGCHNSKMLMFFHLDRF